MKVEIQNIYELYSYMILFEYPEVRYFKTRNRWMIL